MIILLRLILLKRIPELTLLKGKAELTLTILFILFYFYLFIDIIFICKQSRRERQFVLVEFSLKQDRYSLNYFKLLSCKIYRVK